MLLHFQGRSFSMITLSISKFICLSHLFDKTTFFNATIQLTTILAQTTFYSASNNSVVNYLYKYFLQIFMGKYSVQNNFQIFSLSFYFFFMMRLYFLRFSNHRNFFFWNFPECVLNKFNAPDGSSLLNVTKGKLYKRCLIQKRNILNFFL